MTFFSTFQPPQKAPKHVFFVGVAKNPFFPLKFVLRPHKFTWHSFGVHLVSPSVYMPQYGVVSKKIDVRKKIFKGWKNAFYQLKWTNFDKLALASLHILKQRSGIQKSAQVTFLTDFTKNLFYRFLTSKL